MRFAGQRALDKRHQAIRSRLIRRQIWIRASAKSNVGVIQKMWIFDPVHRRAARPADFEGVIDFLRALGAGPHEMHLILSTPVL
jgi:hypothetical protein